MKRKRITQRFPFLLPLRRAQKKLCFYLKMFFDTNRYAKTKTDTSLPLCVCQASTKLFNENTGFDIKYQENKVYNLRLASAPINGLLIRPGETFSFWQRVRHAGRKEKYKEGLSLENGALVTVAGGGLCHLSNFLFWMFLHTPLSIVERHPHRIKDFPSPDASEPDGVDATVSEGWLDLKVQNATNITFQIELAFDEQSLHGRIWADQPAQSRYGIVNREKGFFQKDQKTYERVSVYRQEIDLITERLLSESFLYTDVFEIGYPLPEKTEIEEEKDLLICNQTR